MGSSLSLLFEPQHGVLQKGELGLKGSGEFDMGESFTASEDALFCCFYYDVLNAHGDLGRGD